MKKKKHEKLFHMVKRDDISTSKRIAINMGAIVIALIICAIITTVATGYNPGEVFISFIDGAFGSSRKIWITMQDTAILLLISLALTPAFRMRFWNIGGEGQILMGGLGAAFIMMNYGDTLPSGVVMLLMVVSSIFLGALWGFIPAICKAKWNTNETLSTLMLNYIATQLVAFFIVYKVPSGSAVIGIINQKTRAGWLPELFGSKYMLTILIAVILTISLYYYINNSKQGYELRVVGESEKTAKYVGIKVGWVIVRTMIISGAICGLVGLLLVGSKDHTITTTITRGLGFTAIMVSWMAKFNPFIMIPASLLIVFMNKGANNMASAVGLNESFGEILLGIILFFIIGSEFFVNYKIAIKKKNKNRYEKS